MMYVAWYIAIGITIGYLTRTNPRSPHFELMAAFFWPIHLWYLAAIGSMALVHDESMLFIMNGYNLYEWRSKEYLRDLGDWKNVSFTQKCNAMRQDPLMLEPFLVIPSMLLGPFYLLIAGTFKALYQGYIYLTTNDNAPTAK